MAMVTPTSFSLTLLSGNRVRVNLDYRVDATATEARLEIPTRVYVKLMEGTTLGTRRTSILSSGRSGFGSGVTKTRKQQAGCSRVPMSAAPRPASQGS
jgi:hypothetical protein